MSERALVFLHIPKCSGIAVSAALLQATRPARAFFGFDRAFFGDFTDFDSVGAENRAFMHLSAGTIPRDASFVRAHMSLATLRAAFPDGRFMTVLREPICRLLSHYVFWRGSSPENDAAWGTWAARSGLARGSLESFLSAPQIACQIDNIATRLLLWPHKHIPDNAMIDAAHDPELRAAATARLRALDFVDAIENPAFYANLAHWIDAPLSPARHNETDRLPPALHTRLDDELTPAATALLAARSRLDLILWQSTLAAKNPSLNLATLRQSALLHAAARTTRLLAGT